MLFPWWIEQAFVKMFATCNYLEDGTSIAYDVIIDESSIVTVLTNMTCIASFDGDNLIIPWFFCLMSTLALGTT